MSKGQKVGLGLLIFGSIFLIALSLLDINPKLQIGLTYLVLLLGIISGMIWHDHS